MLQTALLLLVTICPTAPERQSDSDHSLAIAVAAAYRDTIDSHREYVCNYQVNNAHARSSPDALAGKHINPPRICTYTRARCGDLSFFKIIEDDLTKSALDKPKLTKMVIGGKTVMAGEPVPDISRESISDGNQSMSFDAREGKGSVNGSAWIGDKRLMFGCDNPRVVCSDVAYNLYNVLQKKDYASINVKTHTDTPTATIHITLHRVIQGNQTRSPVNYIEQYWFAPGSGHLLTKYTAEFDDAYQNKYELHAAEPALSHQGKWYPKRTIFLSNQKSSNMWHIWDTQITRFDDAKRPDMSVYKITLPAGSIIMDEDDYKKTVVLRKKEEISVDNLRSLYALTQAVANTPLMDTAVPEPSGSRRWLWAAGAVVFAVVTCVVWYLRRRRGIR